MRFAAAFVLAPAVVPIAYWSLSDNDMATVGALTAAGIGYMLALILGVPLLLLFQYFKWNHWWHFLLGGGFIGLVPGVIFLSSVSSAELPLLIGSLFAVGMFAGAVFWVVAFGVESS